MHGSEQLLELLTHSAVALATRFLKAKAVNYLDFAAMIFDEAGVLKHPCSQFDAGATDTQHQRQEFLGQRQNVETLTVFGSIRQPLQRDSLDTIGRLIAFPSHFDMLFAREGDCYEDVGRGALAVRVPASCQA